MRIRRAIAGDGGVVRSVRLRALADAPEAFGSTYAHEVERTIDDWREWISTGATFLAEDDAGAATGLVVGRQDLHGRPVAWALAMWVDPAVRGTGAADALMRAFLTWASSGSFDEARLHVADGNGAARRLYERHGFRATGGRKAGPRGMVEVEMSRPIARE